MPVVPAILRSKVLVLAELHAQRKKLERLNRTLEQANAQLAEANSTLQAQRARELQALEEDTGRYFHFTGSEGLPLDHFSIVLEGTRDEVAEEAVPFRGGEEVHVDIVEPHMYNPDDAVAKVEGIAKIATIRFGAGDVVRHPLVGKIVEAYEGKAA